MVEYYLEKGTTTTINPPLGYSLLDVDGGATVNKQFIIIQAEKAFNYYNQQFTDALSEGVINNTEYTAIIANQGASRQVYELSASYTFDKTKLIDLIDVHGLPISTGGKTAPQLTTDIIAAGYYTVFNPLFSASALVTPTAPPTSGIGQNFAIDATSTAILFKAIDTAAIERTEHINTLQAVGNADGINITIQYTGAEVIIIDKLYLNKTYINSVLVTQVLATALVELNGLYANAGISTNPPTITSSASLSMNQGASINFTPTGTDVVTWSYDSLPVGIVSVEGQHKTIIGGSLLVSGTYNIELRAVNYHGVALQTIVLVISTPFVNTLSFFGSGNAYVRNLTSATYDLTAFMRHGTGSGITEAWSSSFWVKTNFTGTATQSYGLMFFGRAGRQINGCITLLHQTANAGTDNNLLFRYGSLDCYIQAIVDIGVASNTWFHVMWTYSGGDTLQTGNGFFNFYINGVLKTPVWSFSGAGLYYTNISMTVRRNGGLDLSLLIGYLPYSYQYSPYTNMEEFATWKGVILDVADALSLYNSGAPFDLNALFSPLPYTYFRCGDDGDVASYPIMSDNGTSGINLTMLNGTAASYVSDVP